MSKILLTGSHGYLGGRLYHALLEHGHFITRLSHRASADSITFEDLATVSTRFDFILHAGTCYGRKGESEAQIRESNVTKPARLLDLAAATGAVVINIDTALRPNLSLYALTKREFRDRLLQVLPQAAYLNLALDHFYGPGDADNKFPTWLTRQLLFKREAIPLSEGTQERNFIYIDDLVRLLVGFVEGKPTIRGLARVRGPDTLRIRDLATLICGLTSESLSRLEFGKVPQRSSGSEVEPQEDSTIVTAPSPTVIHLREGLEKLIAAERQRGP